MRKVGSQAEDQPQDLSSSYSYRLIEMSSLLSAFQPLHQCEAGGELRMTDDKARRYGNGSVLQIECSKCDTKLELQTSGNANESWTTQSSKDVNRRMVYAASEMGVSREAMSTMCDIFNMPPPCLRNAWSNHVNALYDAHKKAVAENLEKAREKVISLHQPNDANVSEIAVNYDGTWSKRGFTANFGIGFVISVDTGEILDYDFESKLCMVCSSAKRDLGEDTAEFAIWFEGHKDKCSQSHTGSSGSMESSIAKKIWGRSSEYGIQYKFMICDGDSKAYGSIWDAYGCCDLCRKWENTDKRSKEYKSWIESDDYHKWRESHDSGEANCNRAMKLDCIGHVQKRMGTHLRELRKKEKKLKDGKSVKGSKHRLTDKAIDKLTTYYGNAIRANVKPGKLTAEQQKSQIALMQKAILAVLYHSCELSDEKKRHKFCPDGGNSWCSYKRQGTLERKDHHLDPVFLDLLIPEFKYLSQYSLLLRCLPGYSQNVNESLNSLVWNRAPKHRFKGPKSIEMAAMSAIMQFNSGASSRHQVMKAAGIPAGEFTSEGSARKDKTRIFHSVKKATAREKIRRKKIRQAKLAANTRDEAESSYSSGKFNEVDPLVEMGLEQSESDDEDNYPLARLLLDKDSGSSDEDDVPLAQLLLQE